MVNDGKAEKNDIDYFKARKLYADPIKYMEKKIRAMQRYENPSES